MKPLAMLAIAAALAGCASQPTPDWVAGDVREYPAHAYLVGRGQGPSGEEARDRARADLAKIFEAEVTAASTDEQSFGQARYEAHLVRRIEVRTGRLVEGIEIARAWREPGGSHHALAVLPRLKAAHALRARIAELDDATRLHVASARGSEDLFARIAAAQAAFAAQSQRAALQRTLSVVDATGIGEPTAWSVERLRAELQGQLAAVRLAVRADGRLEPLLAAAVAASGFTADAGAPYVLEASLALEATGPVEGWHWQRGALELRLLDAASGRSRGLKRWPIKAAAPAPGLAAQRALDQADAALKSELRSTVIALQKPSKE